MGLSLGMSTPWIRGMERRLRKIQTQLQFNTLKPSTINFAEAHPCSRKRTVVIRFAKASQPNWQSPSKNLSSSWQRPQTPLGSQNEPLKLYS